MNEVRRCPKCGGEMEKGISFGSVMGHPIGGTTLVKKGDFVGDKIFPFYCKECGYVELYKEMKQKKE